MLLLSGIDPYASPVHSIRITEAKNMYIIVGLD